MIGEYTAQGSATALAAFAAAITVGTAMPPTTPELLDLVRFDSLEWSSNPTALETGSVAALDESPNGRPMPPANRFTSDVTFALTVQSVFGQEHSEAHPAVTTQVSLSASVIAPSTAGVSSSESAPAAQLFSLLERLRSDIDSAPESWRPSAQTVSATASLSVWLAASGVAPRDIFLEGRGEISLICETSHALLEINFDRMNLAGRARDKTTGDEHDFDDLAFFTTTFGGQILSKLR